LRNFMPGLCYSSHQPWIKMA